ncbi:hypothetical protein [Photorhabdus cinerea]|uniref:hypothetical protein n=1 Tax=Photorhabdus cinerea TaxID=471575 RepID=UPI001407E8BF|nr:hypothetical protein [Photorhabdus cinerea]
MDGLEVTKHILDSGGKLPSAFELNRMLTGWKKTPEYAFLQEAYTDNLQQKLKDLQGAWRRCFDKTQAGKRLYGNEKMTAGIQSGSSILRNIVSLKIAESGCLLDSDG